jgi:hypothetical protein
MKRYFVWGVVLMSLWFRTGAVAAVYDGKLDLVWRHVSTGQNAVWFMDNVNLAGGAEIQGNSDLGWWIADTGDLNFDGNLDLIWTKSGYENAVWYMDGIQNVGYDYLPVAAASGWRIVGSGDFNADGHPDILLRHDSTGQNAIWLMYGVWIQSGYLLPQVSDLNWRIGATGDFNGDGKSDILWRHMGYGWNAVWYMDGGAFQWAEYFTTQPDTSWELVGSGDFNEDGYRDLVWRNPSRTSQANVIWFMLGSYKVSEAWLPDVANNETAWRIVGVGDFGIYTPASLVSDQDNDDLRDAWELAHFGNLNQTGAGDPDNDGVTNAEERGNGTNPNSSDTDGDGVSDAAEIAHHTDPANPNDSIQPPQEDLVRAMVRIESSEIPYHDAFDQTYELRVGNFCVENPVYHDNEGSCAARSVNMVEGRSYSISVANTGVWYGNPPCPQNRWYQAFVLMTEEDVWGAQLIRPILPETQWFLNTFVDLDVAFAGGGGPPYRPPASGTRYEDAEHKTATLALAKARIWTDGLPETQNNYPGVFVGAENPSLIPIYFEVKNVENPQARVAISLSLSPWGDGNARLYADLSKRVCVLDTTQNTRAEYGAAQLPSVLYLEGVSVGVGYIHLAAVVGEGFDTAGKIKAIRYNVTRPEIAVDNNRDGRLSFDLDDETSPSRPFTFWINNDCDSDSGDDPDGTTPNHSDGSINGIRDLEDFARLHFDVSTILPFLRSGELQLVLNFTNTTGSPAIKLWKAMDDNGGEGYLTDITIAQKHLILNSPGYIGGSQSYTIIQEFWKSLPDGTDTAYLLFEGTGTGKGELILQIKQNGNTPFDATSVWLDLRDVQSMYERAIATPDNINDPFTELTPGDPCNPAVGWNSYPNGYPFQAAWDEDMNGKNYIVFVHGWRMSYNELRNYAETMFKRLWHRGYKGRFAFFRWHTYWNNMFDIDKPIFNAIEAWLSKYNESEYRAWKYGEGLKQYIASLPGGYRMNIAAHSMGNIVVGSALEKGMVVQNYAMLQAAVPATCYDGRPLLYQNPVQGMLGAMYWDDTTPDDHPVEPVRQLTYKNRISETEANVINFYLETDKATKNAWEFNNAVLKPLRSGVIGWTDFYVFDQAKTVLADVLSIKRVYKNGPPFGPQYIRPVYDKHENMALLNQSRTKTAGADGRTDGAVDESVNLGNAPHNYEDEHSAEFTRCIHVLNDFYNSLLDEFIIERKQ